MAAPQQARVLRCCSCRLFQAHQVTKSRKWTCKACGEKQSFLRAYGAGSGADCRRHVQKLNLLQARLSKRPLGPRILEGGAQDEEEPQLEHTLLQPRASESRWRKYLDGGSEEMTLPLPRDPQQDPKATCCLELVLKRKRADTVSPHPCPAGPVSGPCSSLGEQLAPRTTLGDISAARIPRPGPSPTSSAPCAGTLAGLFQTGEDFEEDLF